jgi:hypothetical protein
VGFEEGELNEAPVASLEVTPVAGTNSKRFLFDPCASFDPEDGHDVKIRLDVNNDGVWYASASPWHSYSFFCDDDFDGPGVYVQPPWHMIEPGSYTAVLEVKDSNERVSRVEVPYKVLKSDLKVTGLQVLDSFVTSGEEVFFKAEVENNGSSMIDAAAYFKFKVDGKPVKAVSESLEFTPVHSPSFLPVERGFMASDLCELGCSYGTISVVDRHAGVTGEGSFNCETGGKDFEIGPFSMISVTGGQSCSLPGEHLMKYMIMLPEGAKATFKSEPWIATGGSHDLTFEADFSDWVDEENESNNQATKVFKAH